MECLLDHLPTLITKIIEQCYLVGIATSLAVLIRIPLGILVNYTPRLKPWVIALANILQTIPSLAMLVFLLPFFGIGVKPAIIALILYALLPIIRNTLAALESIPPATIEAARGLGFTLRQRLWLVELPLAFPIILIGVRTAAVINVGIATLAAFIGGGGLGDFITQGLALNNIPLVLLGAIPAVIMALLLDIIIG